MLLDSTEIVKVEIEGAAQTSIALNKDSNTIDIEPLSRDEYMVVRNSLSDSYFIEVSLPSFDTATQKSSQHRATPWMRFVIWVNRVSCFTLLKTALVLSL